MMSRMTIRRPRRRSHIQTELGVWLPLSDRRADHEHPEAAHCRKLLAEAGAGEAFWIPFVIYASYPLALACGTPSDHLSTVFQITIAMTCNRPKIQIW
jgi:hypothetical protein